MAELTEKQKRFCEEYLVDLNATQAAIRAGYSEKTARQIGPENLSKPVIQDYISELRSEQKKRTGITVEKVLREYAKIAFSDIRNLFDGNGDLKSVDDLSEEDAGSIASVEVYKEDLRSGEETLGTATTKKVKMWDKLRALEGLGKHLGMFEKDNNQKAATIQINIDNEDAQLGSV